MWVKCHETFVPQRQKGLLVLNSFSALLPAGRDLTEPMYLLSDYLTVSSVCGISRYLQLPSSVYSKSKSFYPPWFHLTWRHPAQSWGFSSVDMFSTRPQKKQNNQLHSFSSPVQCRYFPDQIMAERKISLFAQHLNAMKSKKSGSWRKITFSNNAIHPSSRRESRQCMDVWIGHLNMRHLGLLVLRMNTNRFLYLWQKVKLPGCQDWINEEHHGMIESWRCRIIHLLSSTNSLCSLSPVTFLLWDHIKQKKSIKSWWTMTLFHVFR